MTLYKKLAALLVFATLAACSQQATNDPSSSSTQNDTEAVQAFLTEIEQSFNGGNLDAFILVFADDAVISSQGSPDVIGAPAIRALYEAGMSQVNMQVSFNTEEILVFGDLAYERGTFTVKTAAKNTGQSLGEVTSRHIHIFKRQADGRWKTWRMMTNSSIAPTPVPAPAAS